MMLSGEPAKIEDAKRKIEKRRILIFILAP